MAEGERGKGRQGQQQGVIERMPSKEERMARWPRKLRSEGELVICSDAILRTDGCSIHERES